MNKLYTTLLIACLAAGFTACNDDDCEDLHLGNLAHYPNVLKGTFPTESQVLELGETLEITPELLNPEEATYSWLVNGKEYSTEPTFSYKIDNPCRANLTCIIKNKYGKVEMSTSFSSNHDFSKGFFYIADGTFNFYDTEEKVTYPDCYASLNAGKTLGMGNYDSANIIHSNGKFYILIKTSTSNRDHFYVVDAKTLYYENSAVVGANLSGLTILNEQYGLVTGDGIRRIDLKSLNNVTVKDEYMFCFYNSMVYNGKVLTNDTYQKESKVKYYDANELISAKEGEAPAATELNIIQKQKFNFVSAKDGNAYTLESTDEGCNIVKISKDFTSLEKTPATFQPTKGGYSDPTVRMAASESENVIYIPSADNTIYKYVIGDSGSLNEPFITADESGLPITSLQLNQQSGELYVTYARKWENGNKIVVYSKDGKVLHTVDCGESVPSQILFNN